MWAMSIIGHSISQWLPCPVPSWVPNTIETWGGNSVKVSLKLFIKSNAKGKHFINPQRVGTSQGSLAGPLLFNIIFLLMTILQLGKICNVYNYAIDNTLSYVNK